MNVKQLAILAGGVGLVVAATVSSHGSPARAAVQTPVSAMSKMCAAAVTWSKHRTAANLDALVVTSFHVPWKWPAADVNQLYVDVRDGSSKYIKNDLHYILAVDCKK